MALCPPRRCGENVEESGCFLWLTCTQHQPETMAASKSNASSKSGSKDRNSDDNEEEQAELCPGFKDVDAFVKVSRLNQAGRKVLVREASGSPATWSSLLATSCSHVISSVLVEKM